MFETITLGLFCCVGLQEDLLGNSTDVKLKKLLRVDLLYGNYGFRLFFSFRWKGILNAYLGFSCKVLANPLQPNFIGALHSHSLIYLYIYKFLLYRLSPWHYSFVGILTPQIA